MDREGDEARRTCQFYAACDNWRDVHEDEQGLQMQCDVCGAMLFVPQSEMTN